MDFIAKHQAHLSQRKNYTVSELERLDLVHMSNHAKKPYEEMLKCFLILKNYEFYLGIPLILDKLRGVFEYSFRNPFDAPGLIIIGFIINIYIIYLSTRSLRK
jgi:hypothetical protein